MKTNLWEKSRKSFYLTRPVKPIKPAQKPHKGTLVALYINCPKGPQHACAQYRIEVPYRELAKYGWATGSFWLTEGMSDQDRLIAMTAVNQADIIELHRTSSVGASTLDVFLDHIRQNGAKVIYSTDDDVTNTSRRVTKESHECLNVARQCDAIITSTPYLAEKMIEATGIKTYYVPNSLEQAHWERLQHTARPDQDTALVIGLHGSNSHLEDWWVLGSVIPLILDKYPHVIFQIGGFHPDYLKKWDDPRIEFKSFLPWSHYPQMVWNCDIVLAPVDPDDEFNRSKSACKVLEAWASRRRLPGRVEHYGGAAVIATDMDVYRQVIKHGKNGLLTSHTPNDWYKALVRLIDDEHLRLRLQRNGYEWMRRKGYIGRTWKRWDRIYQEILGRG